MKIRKTRTEDRGVYRYPVNVPDGKGGYRVEYMTICPGEDDVTETWISTLHSLDDSEVYYNCKNGHPALTEREKEARRTWEAAHPGEKYPVDWNLSLDYLAGEDDCESTEKSKLLSSASTSMFPDESAELEHLHEIVDGMTKRQQEVYKLLFIEECSLTEAAEILGMSITAVFGHKKRIMEIIKKSF